MLPPLNWPDGIDAKRFVRDYWQQRPLLFRNAFPGFENPLTADELGGLACEPEVTSRLVIESRGARPWELRRGPFDADTFDWLGTDGWSLMITDLDKILPDFREALTPFRFIPDWRIDDLMASFAPPGGSVGPHFDAYDVFLFQAEGRRRWHIGPEPADGYTLKPGVDLKIIDNPDHGVALDPCITWSFGFRAPAVAELASAWGDAVAAELPDDLLYRDPDFTPPRSPGEITAAARSDLRQLLRAALDAPDGAFDQFIGQHLTDRAADLALDGPAAVAVCDRFSWQDDNLRALLDVPGADTLLMALAAMGFVEIETDDD